jgi:hypothetical protein
MKVLSLVKAQLKKKRHLNYVETTITELRWQIVNSTLEASCCDSEEGWQRKIICNAKLIRKYERRRKLLKF